MEITGGGTLRGNKKYRRAGDDLVNIRRPTTTEPEIQRPERNQENDRMAEKLKSLRSLLHPLFSYFWILPCNFHHHHIHDLSIYCHIALHDRKIASMMFSWLVRFDVIAMLDRCTSWYTTGSIHIESYLV